MTSIFPVLNIFLCISLYVHMTHLDSFHISECFSCDVNVELSNNVQVQGSRAGRYVSRDPVNNKPAWESGGNALWHWGSEWIFGSLDGLGTGSGGIRSNDNADCPQNVASWREFIGNSQYAQISSSDISFVCGNSIFFIKQDSVCFPL